MFFLRRKLRRRPYLWRLRSKSFWGKRVCLHCLLGLHRNSEWGLPYLSLLQQHLSSATVSYYIYDIRSSFKAFWWQTPSWIFWVRSEPTLVRTIRPTNFIDKNILYCVLWLALGIVQEKKDLDFGLICPRKWYASDSGNHFGCFWEFTLSDISTSSGYVIQNSICGIQ